MTQKYYIEQQIFPTWNRIGLYYETEKEAIEQLMQLNKMFPDQLFRLMKYWENREVLM